MRTPNLVPEPGSRLDRLTTFVLANLLWFIFAILIIPLPAATAGLFATLAPLARGSDTEVFATFFGTMRRQWLKSTVIVAVDVGIGAVIALNVSVLNVMELGQPVRWLFGAVYVFVAVVTLMANLYVWPLLVMFDLRLRRLADVALRMVFSHPVWSLVTLTLALLPLAVAIFAPPVVSAVAVFSTTVLIANWGAWRVIKQHATPDELAELNWP